jgi:hypothetical protein
LRDRELEDERLLERFRLPFVSPFSRRVLFVVAAAMRFAVAVLRPCFLADALIFSYCRFRFALFTPFGGIVILLSFPTGQFSMVNAH